MSRSSLTAATATIAVLAASAALTPIARAQGPVNRVGDPGAEIPSTAWTSSLFIKANYGFPGTPTSEVASGIASFAALPGNAGAKMTQRVDVSDRASAIDAGNAATTFVASLGGTGGGSAAFSAQPLSEDGTPVGGPVTLGPPSAEDRANETLLVPCEITINALPPSTRALDLSVTSPTGSGFADDIGVYDGVLIRPAVVTHVPYQGRFLTFSGTGTNGCSRAQISTVPTPVEAARLRVTVATPKRVRAGQSVTLRVKIRNVGAGARSETPTFRVRVPKGLRVAGARTRSVASLRAGASRTVTVRVRTTSSSKTSNVVRLTVSGPGIPIAKKSVRVRLTKSPDRARLADR